MNTGELARTLAGCIRDFLAWAGVPRGWLEEADEALFLVLVAAAGLGAGAAAHFLLTRFARKVLRRRDVPFLRLSLERHALRRVSAVIPPLLVAVLLPSAFGNGPAWTTAGGRLALAAFFVALQSALNALLDAAAGSLASRARLQNRPLKGFVQLFQVATSCLTAVVAASVLLGKSPLRLVTGLGAFAAVLMLVFKDTILGFVAGVLLAENDMVRVGDWIEMPEGGVNGVVTDITLTVVKVRNFDNTIVTVPPYTLVSGSFTNWRGMTDSGGRRIMRGYTLKLDHVRPATPGFLERMKAFDADLAAYIAAKQRQAAAGQTANTDNPAGLPDGTIDTNAGLLRAYLAIYLRRHPSVSKDMLLMVRTLPPAPEGLPLQIYCFSGNTDWAGYESVQAEIMEHVAAVLPRFGLCAYQRPAADDLGRLPGPPQEKTGGA